MMHRLQAIKQIKDVAEDLDAEGTQWNRVMRLKQSIAALEQEEEKPEELEMEIFRSWFGAIQDLNSGFLDSGDYWLAKKLYERLGLRVPNSVLDHCRTA